MFVSVILCGLRRWMRSRETIRQLSALTDQELSDIAFPVAISLKRRAKDDKTS